MTTLSLAVVALSAGVAGADETPSAEKISQWVKQLDADEYATRQAAQTQLEKAGVAAIDAVREAAVGESQEAAVRSIEILKRHAQSDDAALQETAQQALRKLVAGDDEIVAQRAAAALQSDTPQNEPAEPQQAKPVPLGPRGIRIGGGGAIRIEAHAVIGGKGARRISIKNVDGNKEIDVEEGDRKIKIVESAEGHIKMKITGKEDDMDGTKEVEAESAEQLKKKDEEAYKVYEKYTQRGGRARIEFRALPAGPRPVPRIVPRRVLPKKDNDARFDEAIKRLEEARKKLEDAEGAQAEEIDKALQRIEKLRDNLQQRKAELEDDAAEAEPEAEAEK